MEQQCIEAYQRLKNLKLVGLELGMPWQSVYVQLKKAGVNVVGDKTRYGSDKDRLSAKAEQEFQRLVLGAECQNEKKFQAKVDFFYRSYAIDIKASLPHSGYKEGKYLRWAFSLKKQEMLADFIVCFGFSADDSYDLFVLPGEMIRKYQTITIPIHGRAKWRDYKIAPADLLPFMDAL